jgi:endo-1,4-beta-mannosidase
MRRNSATIITGGKPVRWLGANFWSRTGGPFMWRSYDPTVVTSELRTLREHGLTMTRSFFFWPDFMPEPERIDETMAERFADFLDRHADVGMQTIPTFIVGHMSGENWDPSWRNGRSLYSDVWLVGRQSWFAAEMVRRYTRHPAIAGWLVSNEMPIYGGSDERPEVVEAWARIIRDAVRAAGGHQPFSLGDGAWGIEVRGKENGFQLAMTAAISDFLGPHTYPVGDDRIRQHYAAAWECELAGTFGKPVVLEEFGVSSDFASSANAARYYRQVLHNSLLAGATGWIAWNNTDFDLPGQDPYRHHAFEQHFGLTDASGAPKQTLHEMRAFATTLAMLGDWERADSGTAIIIPSYLDNDHPFTSPADGARSATVLRQSYVSARLADLAPALVRESRELTPGARLYLSPSTKQFLATTASDLERLVTDGACVYVSYSPGDNDWHRGPSYGRLNEFFGVTHRLETGMSEPITDDVVTFTLRRDWGGLAAGTTMRFRAAGNEHGRGYLPVEATGAEILAIDGHGRPALLLRRTGRGSVVLCTYPIEHMAALSPRVNPDDTVTLYNALAIHAGVPRPVTVEDPRVACDVLVRSDGTRFAALVSQASEPLTLKPAIEDGSLDREVSLAPFGTAIVALTAKDDKM